MTLPLLVLAACQTADDDWPAAEVDRLRAECATAPVPGTTPATCQCLYDRLPAVVKWKDFSRWREAPVHEGAARDPETTKKVADVSAACATSATR